MKFNKTIFKEAEKRYNKWGASAVYDYAHSINIKHWSICTQCNECTPSINKTCLICGSKKERNSYNEI